MYLLALGNCLSFISLINYKYKVACILYNFNILEKSLVVNIGKPYSAEFDCTMFDCTFCLVLSRTRCVVEPCVKTNNGLWW
jgi:hypothetical protein